MDIRSVLNKELIMKNFRYLKNVSTLNIDKDKCIGCGMCTEVCPHGVFELNSKKADMIDYNGCMECGACSQNCPSSAITVNPGVGCAAYIIQTWLKGTKLEKAGSCC